MGKSEREVYYFRRLTDWMGCVFEGGAVEGDTSCSRRLGLDSLWLGRPRVYKSVRYHGTASVGERAIDKVYIRLS